VIHKRERPKKVDKDMKVVLSGLAMFVDRENVRRFADMAEVTYRSTLERIWLYYDKFTEHQVVYQAYLDGSIPVQPGLEGRKKERPKLTPIQVRTIHALAMTDTIELASRMLQRMPGTIEHHTKIVGMLLGMKESNRATLIAQMFELGYFKARKSDTAMEHLDLTAERPTE
jgi:hypothetical protein